MSTKVRLLELADADGAWNMALDEALLDGAAAGRSPMTLRFYGWTRPCVSLGCVQSVADLDLDAVGQAGLPVVRRASGGTAVLHENAIGFSLAIPADSPLAVRDIVESYRVLGEPVHRALLALGVEGRLVPPAEAHRGGRPTGLGSSACFASLAPYEVTRDGRKVVGTSQIRRRGAILHHVMIPLAFDAPRLAGFLAVESDDERRELTAYLEARIGAIGPNPPVSPSPRGKGGEIGEVLVAALISALAEMLDLAPVPGTLTPDEAVAAERLLATKYASDEWTYRR